MDIENKEQQLQRLRQAIEAKVGYSIRTPKDFDRLAKELFTELHQQVSPTTLKRLWGYVTNDFVPRTSTLNILAQFVGYTDWSSFCKEDKLPPRTTDEPSETPAEPPVRRRRQLSTTVMVVAALLVGTIATVAVLWLTRRLPATTDAASPYFLHKGQHFANEQDYLPLFGIHANDSLWGQRLDHHPSISVWTPLYHHPEWHNDGDSAALMPTITEWWEPYDVPVDSLTVTIRNQDRYVSFRDLNELRITFMRGLTPDGDSITYLGVYRLDLKRSNQQHLVWHRILENLDLNRLDYLEELRN